MSERAPNAAAAGKVAWPDKSWPQIAALVAITVASFVLILAAYGRATSDAAVQLHAQERILARQAVTGISDYFDYHAGLLRFLGSMPEVRDMTEEGKSTLRSFFRANEETVASVTRVDESGTLVYTYPYETTARVSLAGQPHVARFLAKRTPVLSGVFTAVQGFAAIALYCPVNDGKAFRGGIAILVPFEKLSKRYVERVSIGDEGYAVLVDGGGTILYSPVPGESGRPAAEAWSAAPQLAAAALAPAAADEGAIAFSDSSGGSRRPERQYGYRVSSPVVDTAWTVIVRAPESEALGFILGFRNAWISLAASLVAAFAFWSAYLARSAARLRSANAALLSSNTALEVALDDLRSTQDRLVLSGKMAALGQVTASIAHQFNTPLAAIVSADDGIIHALRDDFSEALETYAALPPRQKEAVDALWSAAAIAATAPPDRRLRTDRNAVAEAEARLSFEGAQAAGEIAELLADMGTLDRIDAVLPLADGERGRRALRIIASFASALGSSTIIRHAAEKASATVSALRTYVRADRSEGWTTVDVAEEIDILLALYVEVPRSQVHVVRRYAEGAFVRGVPDRLGQIWVNIIDNAIHAMGGVGALEIETRVGGGIVTVAIADSGPGIPPDIAARIFEPFFTTKPRGEGSGIGLDVARGIAREHGGDISFESRPGRTVFVISLPAAPPPG